jgi:quaternary ammonium compound-resistance protein SugE
MFSLKFLSFAKIKQIKWSAFFSNIEGIVTLLPLLAYIIFGLINVWLLALAMKDIATSIAFAVWMGLSLIGVRMIEVLILKESFSAREALFITLIVVGIIGLKKA